MAREYCSIEESEPLPPRIECPHAEEGCHCQLCPEELALDKHSHPIWYPDEPICNRRKYQRLPWIRNQKRIARVGAPSDRYFTVDMLDAVVQVRKGIVGVSPDQTYSHPCEAEAIWIAERNRNKSPP